MATVITHFHNEERMLQWWLPHHQKLFSDGILINHASTDRSVEVCRDLAPNWRVVDTELENFDAINNDFEVMKHEASVAGWKVALNVTEFLVVDRFDEKLAQMQAADKWAFKTQGVIMVDKDPANQARIDLPLVQQKHHGFIERRFRHRVVLSGKKVSKLTRQRVIHRHMTGGYGPGRHKSFRKTEGVEHDAFVFWYGFCPWDDEDASERCSSQGAFHRATKT